MRILADAEATSPDFDPIVICSICKRHLGRNLLRRGVRCSTGKQGNESYKRFVYFRSLGVEAPAPAWHYAWHTQDNESYNMFVHFRSLGVEAPTTAWHQLPATRHLLPTISYYLLSTSHYLIATRY